MAAVAQSQSGQEPPSGIQGSGTVNEPYDQGNAPDNVSKSAELPTVAEPDNQGDASKTEPTAVPSSKPISGTSTPTSDSKTPATNGAKTTEERGRDALRAPSKNRIEERDVSPGTLPDGSHAKTSGERGEGYEPGKLNKLKSKLAFGKH